MTGRHHLLVETPRPTLARGMRGLNGVHTRRVDRRHGRPGRLFQGRCTAALVELAESHLLELCRHVIPNPVRARMVRDLGLGVRSCSHAPGRQGPTWQSSAVAPWFGRGFRRDGWQERVRCPR